LIDVKTGNSCLNFSCGEVITAIKYSPNYKFLIGTTSLGCMFIWKVPSNIEREIMFKSNQKALRITETPRAGTSSEIKAEGFEQLANASIDKERKAWNNESNKPPIDYTRETLPDWARSTVGGDNLLEEDGPTYQPKKFNEMLSKLQETISDTEDGSDESDSEAEEPCSASKPLTDLDDEQEENDTEEESDVFNFDKSKIRKTSVPPTDLLNRQSRIGNIMRSSQVERSGVQNSAINKSVSSPGSPDYGPKYQPKASQKSSNQSMKQSKKVTNESEMIKKIEQKVISKSSLFA